jgi:hypothetical protein
MRLYVFGHEFTPALWDLVLPGRVKRFKASARGGHVVVTKTNFLIVLAPYSSRCMPWAWCCSLPLASCVRLDALLEWFHLLLGAAYAFHITSLGTSCKPQSDITSQGSFLSGVIIFLGNSACCCWASVADSAGGSAQHALGWWLQDSGAVLLRARELFEMTNDE